MMKKNFIKILPIFAIFFIPLFFRVNLVHAASGAGVPYGSVPTWVAADINTHCNPPYNWGLVSDTWLSPVGQPSQTNVNVSQGATSVDLELNQIYYRCHVNGGSRPVNGLQDVTFISRADNTDIPVPISLTGSYPSTSLGNGQYNQTVVRQVKYTPSSPFQASRSITVNLYNRGYYSATNDINRCSIWNRGDYNGEPNQNSSDPYSGGVNCVTGISPLTINVTVTSVMIQGAVYSSSDAPLKNVPITGTNINSGLKTGSPFNGWFQFALNIGKWFSISAQDPFIDSTNGHTHSDVKIIPYIGNKNMAPDTVGCNFNGINKSGALNYKSYEWQNANSPKSGTVQCDYGLTGNGGYDFRYSKEQYAVISASASVSASGAYPGSVISMNGSTSVSQTLPDDGSDTYSYSISPSVVPPNASDTTFNGANCSASNTIALRPEGTHSRNCSITIPASSAPGTKYCITTTISSKPSYALVSGSPAQACVKVLKAPSITIGPRASHEIGSSTPGDISYILNCNSFTGSLTYSIAVSPAGPHSISSANVSCSSGISINGVVGNTPSFLDTLDPNIYSYTPIITSAIPVSGQAAVPGIPISGLSGAVTVYTVPYARFYGNDIASGSGSIYFTNHDNQPLTTSSSSAGSAAQYAAIAKTTILVATAAFRSTAPASPIGLSALTSAQVAIASTNNTSGAKWLGDWSTSGYYGDTNATTTINGANSVASKITIVGNDIYIKGNITVDSTKLPSASNLFDNASIPVITLIAKNNIYIDPSVTQIDALLQAGKDIYTCSTGAAATPSASCKNTLLVNGVVGANGEVGANNAIHFDRVCGTRLFAPSAEDSDTAGTYMTNNRNPNCSGSYKSGTAAEVINFPSYLYFANPYISGATQTQYQSIYSAPPLL